MNPESSHESPFTSESDTDYSDYNGEDEDEDEDSSTALAVPDSTHENKVPSLEEVSRLWNHAMQYRILCRIKCFHRRQLDYHFAEFYEDVPFKSRDSGVTSRHLSGHIPVPNIRSYLSATERPTFIVFREYLCGNPRQHAPRRRKTVFPRLTTATKNRGDYDEFLSIISKSLDQAIRRIAISDPQDYVDPPEWQHGRLVFLPPYRFVYHHRTLLLEHAKTCNPAVKSQILALLDYVEGTYRVRYKQADDLFQHGKTNQRSLELLFCPSDIVISCAKGVYSALTLNLWPLPGSILQLRCWGWVFDGSQFKRKISWVVVQGHGHGDAAIPIQKLSMYPIKYAPQGLRDHLRSRGQRFWNLRFQHYVSYTGWDVMKDENHVRQFSILILIGK